MVKGCERRVIVYKSNDSKYFYEAYFFMKPEVCAKSYKKSDIIEEANRIVKESALGDGVRVKRRVREALLYASVFILGGVLSSIVTLFISSNL